MRICFIQNDECKQERKIPAKLCVTSNMQIQLTLSLRCRLLVLMRPLGHRLLALAHLVVDHLSPLQ